jgi:non-ribosomal peptide synthetase-like protein
MIAPVAAPTTPMEARPSAAPSPTQSILAELLAGVLHVDHVPPDSHFFEELGADSMVMALFCARVRKRSDLPPVSMRDVYLHPTLRSLTAALEDAAPRVIAPAVREASPAPEPAGGFQYFACGVLQLVIFLGYTYVAVSAFGRAYEWVAAASGPLESYLRLVLFGAGAFVSSCLTPIVAKWVLIGRWKPTQIRLWSLHYVRFWLVKNLMRANPCALLFVGTPLYVLYLRALGAKIGRGTTIFSRRVPVCTDLFTVDEGTVIRREAFIQCYRVRVGHIETGPVTLGRDVVIGERAVLDIQTSVGDGGQLGQSSALQSGQAVPSGEHWHGSPAERTDLDYLQLTPLPTSRLRAILFSAGTLLMVLFLYVPFVASTPYWLSALLPSLAWLVDPAVRAGGLDARELALHALQLSSVLFFGGMLVALPFVLTLPRLLNLFLVPDRIYPLYGFHDRLQRAITRVSNVRLFMRLFGDSSYIVHYLGWLGYRLQPLEQTGSNFGCSVTHGNPLLCSVGKGTMVADGLAFINDEVSTTSFCVRHASIGSRSFLGNDVTYPPGARTGDNVLLATKVLVPLDGPVRENTGLLGSPSFPIPRTVDRDMRYDHLRAGDGFRRLLAAKNRYNIRTMGVFLFFRWFGLFLLMLIDLTAFALYDVAGHVFTALLLASGLLVLPIYYALVERGLIGARSLKPLYCSIYDRRFWHVERVWKVAAEDYLHSFNGTAYKTFVWRLMGVRVGKQVFDDGVHLSERTLTTIGDGSVLNAGSRILCHSQEDATFKSEPSTIGAGCTLGVGALVHYGVTMGDHAELAADSFLMKGSEVPAHARWTGNPAREV